jgi:hypothetical protein
MVLLTESLISLPPSQSQHCGICIIPPWESACSRFVAFYRLTGMVNTGAAFCSDAAMLFGCPNSGKPATNGGGFIAVIFDDSQSGFQARWVILSAGNPIDHRPDAPRPLQTQKREAGTFPAMQRQPPSDFA